jgi:hypothetical protein
VVSHFDGGHRVHSGEVAPVKICGSLPLEARHTREPDRTVDNAFHPNVMSPAERLDEVARLLALGYLRLRARRQAEKANDPNHLREFGLDFTAEGSVCDTDAHAERRRR